MKAFLRLLAGLCPDRELSVVSGKLSALSSCHPSDTSSRLITIFKPYDKPKASYYLRPFLLLILVFVSCGAALAQEPVVHTAPAAKAEAINGIVVSAETGEPLEGATVRIKNTNIVTLTNEKGEFTLTQNNRTGAIEVSFLGYQSTEISFTDNTQTIVISLEEDHGALEEVTVNTGYQEIPKERATGSFAQIDNELLNRKVGSNILDRIEDLTPGILFDRNEGAPDALLIRGRSTIYSNTAPLIVLDNFPYDGDIGNINPSDIENITILKDAAAASIWGARAGNGVIVIKTKTGVSSEPTVRFTSSAKITDKPDLYGQSNISSSDFIDLEIDLYNKGFYNALIENTFTRPPLTPVIELLADSEISQLQKNNTISDLRLYDVRRDLERYFYQTAIDQAYALNISGRTDFVNYYFSTGYDSNVQNLIGSQNNRLILRSNNTFKLNEKIELTAGLTYIRNNNMRGGNPALTLNSGGGKGLYPYARLVDEDGKGLEIVKNMRKGYMENLGVGNLYNWTYRPYEEILASNFASNGRDIIVNTALNYKVNKLMNADVKYQFENALNISDYLQSEDAYYTRDLINKFYQPNEINKFPAPKGGIRDVGSKEIISHQARVQLNFNKQWSNVHEVSAMTGWEIRDVANKGNGNRYYGYQRDGARVVSSVNYESEYPQYDNPYSRSRISGGESVSESLDRFLSYYGNISYTHSQKYTVSGSARIDQANLFGVSTNQKGVPLWSAGAVWKIDRENFYNFQFLPSLQLRITYGTNGNISRRTSALTTANYTSARLIPETAGTILNPPNSALRWEKVRMFNSGLDFAFRRNVFHGSVEYYRKNSVDLLGQAPLDPTLGVLDGAYNGVFYGNVASVNGAGMDINLGSDIRINGIFWKINGLLSYTKNRILEYMMVPASFGNAYLNSHFINPFEGKPLFSLYSFKWKGLDPVNGDPLGELNGNESKDWGGIYSSTTLNDMVYNGPVQPELFGALRNTLSYRNLSLSVNISFKSGYFFRGNSINYNSLMNGWEGHGDYGIRWQKKGDETHTSVPSFQYPVNIQRDRFYDFAEILVEKGDHVRLEDIRLDYNLLSSLPKTSLIKKIQCSLYANNLGVLWTANKKGIDPYFQQSPRIGKSIALGLTADF